MSSTFVESPPCTLNTNIGCNGLALDSKYSLLDGIVAYLIGVLSNCTDELRTGGCLHPLDLLRACVEAAELDGIVLLFLLRLQHH